MRKLLLIVLLLVALPLSSAFGQQERVLPTIFASNNSLSGPNAGFFFDLENVSPAGITILRWDVNIDCDNDITTTVSLYTRVGTSQGFETTMDGWNFIGTEAGIVCAGDDFPTPYNVGNISIDPGEIVGIAMVIENDTEWQYTNGTGTNQIYNDGALLLSSGSSIQPAFTPPVSNLNTPRVWNGIVYYSFSATNVPTLSEWGLMAMAGILGVAGFVVIRRRQLAA